MVVSRHHRQGDQPAALLVEARHSLHQFNKEGGIGLVDAIFEDGDQGLDRHAFSGKGLVDFGR